MAKRALRRVALPLTLALGLIALAPAAANAKAFNFFNTAPLFPPGLGTVGHATLYPSSVQVSGITEPVSRVTVTLLDFSSGKPKDADILLAGPDGDLVMLMSDACGTTGSLNNNWTFDDDAAAQLSQAGPCGSNAAASFRPTNYVGNAPEPDDFGAGGGVTPPYGSSLAVFNGKDPNGPWDLFGLDDEETTTGLEVSSGWVLTIETTPAAGPPAPTVKPKPTGRRARALKRCKNLKTKKARSRCRARAVKLPR